MGFIILTIAITVGLSSGAFLGYWLSNALVSKLSNSSIAPRFVMVCSIVGAILITPPTLFISFVVGGNIGGGGGSYVSESVGLGSAGAPVGLAIGIAIIIGGSLTVGTLIGGLLGRLLAHVLPKSVLTCRSSGTARIKPRAAP